MDYKEGGRRTTREGEADCLKKSSSSSLIVKHMMELYMQVITILHKTNDLTAFDTESFILKL